MSRRLFSPLALTVLIALAVWPVTTPAQSQDSQSIADAARRSRDQKKNAAKASKVVTDDDIAPAAVKPMEQGATGDASQGTTAQPADSSSTSAPEAAGTANSPPPATAAAVDTSSEDRELAQLKTQLAQVQKELDLDQRELALDQDTHLSNPDYQHDDVGKAKVDADKRQIDDKQQAVDRLKTRIAALQELENRKKSAASAPMQNTSVPPQP